MSVPIIKVLFLCVRLGLVIIMLLKIGNHVDVVYLPRRHDREETAERGRL